MPTPVSALRNLGPATQAAFARADIHSAEELVALGADAAYRRLLDAGERPHFIGYYALVMALQGRPWNDCHGAEKTALRARFDAIKSAARPSAPNPRPSAAFEKALDALGLARVAPHQTRALNAQENPLSHPLEKNTQIPPPPRARRSPK